MILTIAILISWHGLVLIDATRNYIIIEVKKQRPNYLASFCFRSFVVILFGGLCLQPETIKEGIMVVLYLTSAFWITFDLSLNLMRKKPVFYYGKNSGWIDEFFQEVRSIPLFILCKAFAFALMIYTAIRITQFPL